MMPYGQALHRSATSKQLVVCGQCDQNSKADAEVHLRAAPNRHRISPTPNSARIKRVCSPGAGIGSMR